jgi:WD40 repeat protein
MTEYFADDTDYPLQSLTFSPDSTILAGGGLEGVILWDVTTGEVRRLSGHSKPVLSVAFSPDGQRLASGSFDETVIVWNLPSGRPFQTLPGHSMGAASLMFSSGGRWLISGDQQQTIRAWSVETGLMLQTIEGRGQDLALGAGGTLLAFKRTLDDIVLWDIFGVGEVTRLTGGRPLVFSPDSRLLISGSEDGIATLWGVQ